MNTIEQATHSIKNPETSEDFQYVANKIHQLVDTFNKLNQSKGCEIMQIGINVVTGQMNCNLMQRNVLH